MNPLVSVVIPNHDYGRYVVEAVESVLAQDYRPLEVIVVDNGSSDDSLERLAMFGDRIRVIAQEDRGQSGGRNRGIGEASGDLVALLDADDVWESGKLAAQVPLFEDPRVGMVYSGVLECGPELEERRGLRPVHRGDVRQAFVDRVGEAVILGGESTVVIRRSCFEEHGTFDSSLTIGAGWDLYRRISTGFRVDFVDRPLVRYRIHGTNTHLQTDRYYDEMVGNYERLFADPEWRPFFGRRRRCESMILRMRGKDRWKAGRRMEGLLDMVRSLLLRTVPARGGGRIA